MEVVWAGSGHSAGASASLTLASPVRKQRKESIFSATGPAILDNLLGDYRDVLGNGVPPG